NETSAHLAENGRITLMWCAFDGAPNILRLYGRGRVVLPSHDEWADLAPRFTITPSTRQIIVVDVSRVQTSCGYIVPFYAYEGERDTHERWADALGESGLDDYRRRKNVESIDCLTTPIGEALRE